MKLLTDDFAVVRDGLDRARSFAASGCHPGYRADYFDIHRAALDRIEREYAEEVALNESALRVRLAEAERVLREIADGRPAFNGKQADWRANPNYRTGEDMAALARAHLAAIDYAAKHRGCEAFNIGTGSAYSVLQIVDACERASGRAVPYQVSERRAGDIATSVARVDKARDTLGWTSGHTLDDICQSSWNWQSRNPEGYGVGEA